jgi:hypothetical protein
VDPVGKVDSFGTVVVAVAVGGTVAPVGAFVGSGIVVVDDKVADVDKDLGMAPVCTAAGNAFSVHFVVVPEDYEDNYVVASYWSVLYAVTHSSSSDYQGHHCFHVQL